MISRIVTMLFNTQIYGILDFIHCPRLKKLEHDVSETESFSCLRYRRLSPFRLRTETDPAFETSFLFLIPDDGQETASVA
jgi:hypothetical protein